MKRSQILLFLLFLLAIPYVSAQSSYCQYGFTESYSENETVLTYEDSNIISGKIPIFSDFVKGNKSSSFMTFNPNSYELVIMFNYTVEGHGGGNKAYGLKVPPNSYGKARENCYADGIFGECNINQSTLKYFILKPQIMYPKELMVNKTREVCCTSGQKNCSNSCITPSTKTAGEAYQCDWECQSGIGDGICKWTDGHSCTQPTDCLSGKCNIAGVCGDFIQCPNGTQSCNDKLCVKPLNKTIGEAYSCIWECQSGAGKEGVCQKSMSDKVRGLLLFVAIIGLISAVAQYFHQKSKKVVEELTEIEKKLKKAKKDKEKIDEDLKNVKKRAESEIRELELKKINAKEEAKKEVDAQIAKRKEETAAELEELTIQIAKIDQEKAKMIQKKNEFENEALKTNASEFGQERENLEITKEGYIKFKRYPDGRPSNKTLHAWVAENQIYNAHKKFFSSKYPNMYLGNGGLEVHHIDYDKLHNTKENLAVISKEEHTRIIHKDIPKGDWNKGIQILIELGIKQPHIPKLRTQPQSFSSD